VDLYLDSLGPMGIEAAAQIAPKLVVPQVPRSDLGGFAGGGRLAGVCPGASSEHKSWGRQRFAELVRQLRGRGYGIRVVGSAADRCEVEGVVAEACGRGDPGIIGHVTDDVAAMSDLLSGCGAVVSNDSGLMHLAAAAGSRAIGIFGPTSPLLGFAPLGPGCRVVTLNARCSPCSYHGNRPCKMKTRFCMEAIHPNEVASIVDDTAGTGASV
jgi:heptosyltransferase-2